MNLAIPTINTADTSHGNESLSRDERLLSEFASVADCFLRHLPLTERAVIAQKLLEKSGAR